MSKMDYRNIEKVADLSGEAFRFFLDKYGPAPTSRVVISPIPGSFGQGFPGLVYASTLSYLSPADPPLSRMRSPVAISATSPTRPPRCSRRSVAARSRTLRDTGY